MTDTSDYATWTWLVMLHGRVESRLAEALRREHSLGVSEYRALCYLAKAEQGELRMQELSDLTGLDQSSVSRLVQRLEKAGLAERVHCDGDRRGVHAAITETGRQRQASACPTYTAELSRTLDEQSADENLGATVERLRAT